MCKNMNAIKMNLNHGKLRSKTGGLLCYLQCFGEGLMQKKYAFHVLRSAIHAKKHTVQPNV
jgi:hypothetical protein